MAGDPCPVAGLRASAPSYLRASVYSPHGHDLCSRRAGRRTRSRLVPASLAGRGRRGVPVSRARRRRAGRAQEGRLSAPRRGGGPPRRDLGGAAARSMGARRARTAPRARTRLLAFLGRRFGPGFLLPMLLAEEGREVKAYLDMHRTTRAAASPARDEALAAREGVGRARDDAQRHRRAHRRAVAPHGRGRLPAQRRVRLQRRAHRELRPRRRRDRRDGRARGASHVIVAGVAGLIADALSMGSSGYLAAKSEQEVYAHEIAMERDEIALMPEIERDELALIYEAKGMDRDSAHALATQVMADPRADARRAGAGGARDRRAGRRRRCARRGSPDWRRRSAR